MISFSLFWFAVPLAVLGAVALRMTILLFRGLSPTPAMAGGMSAHLPTDSRVPPEPILPASSGAGAGEQDIMTNAPAGTSPSIKTIPTVRRSRGQEDKDDRPRRDGPMALPTFRTAWATLAGVFILTACILSFSRLVLLAVMAILQSKGMVKSGDLGMIYTMVEAVLLPIGFIMLAWVLQEMLPTTFLKACTMILVTMAVCVLMVFLFFALFLGVTYLFDLFFSFFR